MLIFKDEVPAIGTSWEAQLERILGPYAYRIKLKGRSASNVSRTPNLKKELVAWVEACSQLSAYSGRPVAVGLIQYQPKPLKGQAPQKIEREVIVLGYSLSTLVVGQECAALLDRIHPDYISHHFVFSLPLELLTSNA